MFLLVAAVACWLTVIINIREINRTAKQIWNLNLVYSGMIVDDVSMIAFVELERLWLDHHRWDVYLPPGRYRLCLATRGISADGFPPMMKSTPIPSGTHRLVLAHGNDDESWMARASLDGSESLMIEEAHGWGAHYAVGDHPWSYGGQKAPGKPVILYRVRFEESTVPQGPSDGIMMWIEPVPGPGPTGP